MKKILFILLITFSISTFSQSAGFSLLKKVSGIEIYEKKTITKTTEKHDYWIVEFEYINTTKSDLYYNTTLDKSSNGTVRFEDISFCTFDLENKKTFDTHSDLYVWITGDKTRIKLENGESIFVFKKNKVYSKVMKYKVEKGKDAFLTFNQNESKIITENLNDFL